MFSATILEQNSHVKPIFFPVLSLSAANVIFWFIAVLLNLGFGCSLGSLKFNAVVIWINSHFTSTADCHIPLLLEMFTWGSTVATCSCLGRKKSTTRTCRKVGGKAESWTWVYCLQQNTPVTELLVAWAFSLSPPLLFPSPSPPTTNPICEIILLKNSWPT